MPSDMRVYLFESDNGECPYLPDRRWVTQSFQIGRLRESIYEGLLGQGWRRSGFAFYRNQCPGCDLCIPIRVPVQRFEASKSQRRVLRRNHDVTVSRGPLDSAPEVLELYRRYHAERHGPSPELSGDSFRHFLGSSPIRSELVRYHVGERLLGLGWVDLLSQGLSTVYFAFDPTESRRSLGTFSILTEIEIAAGLGKQWYYLGFYVPGSPKMAYKANFRPHQLLVDGRWQEQS